MSEGTETRKERNIMILFLSNFIFSRYTKDKLDENGNKILNADGKPQQESRQCLLPPGRYKMEALNAAGNKKPWVECVQTNEAPIKDVLLTLNGQPLDAIFCLVSDKVGGRSEGSSNVTVWKNKESDECQTFKNEMEFFLEKRLPSINEDSQIKNLVKKPLTADIFREVEFHESADDPSAESIRVATELEDAIKEYIAEENKKGHVLSIKECHIYADITGGKRTANMAISAALQLLQYDKANLERVIYSDYDRDRPPKINENKPIHPVSNVQPIHDLYQLVAGVDAFKKYGSSAALNDYFALEKDCFPQLKQLLEAMDRFSAAVLLCDPDSFENELRNLTNSIKEFSKQVPILKENSPKIKLLARMLPDFKHIYEDMLIIKGNELESADRVKVIKWCVKNSLIQQALTFITEWMPHYFVDHRIAYTDDEEIIEICALRGTGMKRDWKKTYILEYAGEQPNKQKLCAEMQANIQQVVKELKKGADIQEVSDMLTMDKELYGIFINFLRKYEESLIQVQNNRNRSDVDNAVIQCLDRGWRKRMLSPEYHTSRQVFFENATKTEILRYLASAKINEYIDIFKLPLPKQGTASAKKKKKYPLVTPTFNPDISKAQNRQCVYQALLDCGMMKTIFPRNITEHLLLAYSEIHDLRNQSNHAAQSVERAPFAVVREKLEKYLSLLDEIIPPKEAAK